MITERSDSTSLKFVLPVTVVFFTVSAIGIYNHELWLDEAQHFLIARDSNSLTGLYYNMQYDGHVRLWNYLLYFITHYISASPVAMQTFHLLIITATAFVFLRFAPFDLVTKLLILSGYFFLYEYNVLSRNYAMGILFLFICCRLFANENKNMRLIGLMLVLMSNTHLFFAFAAAGLFIYLFAERWMQKKFDKNLFIFCSFFVLAITTVIVQIHIPSDNTYFHPEQAKWNSFENFSIAFYGLAKGFLPLPLSIHRDFWNHFLFDKLPSLPKLFFAVLLIAYPFLLLRKSRPVLAFYGCSVLLLFAFLLISQSWASRYFGMVFIFFIAAAWLAGNNSIEILSIKKISSERFGAKLFYGFFYVLLMCHLFTGFYAYINDLTRPFTEAKNVVQYIKSNREDTNPIVVDGYGAGPAISAYLGARVFYLNIDQPGSYCYFKKSYFENSMGPLEGQLMRSAYINAQDSFLLVSFRVIDNSEIRGKDCVFEFHALKNFKNGIIKPDYYIYHVTRKDMGLALVNENKIK